MSASQTLHDRSAALAGLRPHWGWFVALGALLLGLGLLASGDLLLATLASVFFVGAAMLAAGLAQVVHAFRVKGWGSFFLWLLSGLLYGAAGVFALLDPGLAMVVLTLLLALALIASGALRIAAGFGLRPFSGWGWLLASGLVSILAGVVSLLGWPLNSLWLLGLALAFDLAFQGVAATAFGLTLRAAR